MQLTLLARTALRLFVVPKPANDTSRSKWMLSARTISALAIFVTLGLERGASVRGSEKSPLPATTADIAFERDVRPILKAMCFHCHGEEEHLQGGLDLRLVRLMQTGGESGPSVIPGDHSASLLWKRIESDEMPEGSKKLSAAQKTTIRQWIDGGTLTLRPEPANVADARYTPEELQFWAFQPPAAVPSPAATPAESIDAFIAQKLAASGLEPAPQASRGTLLRRLTVDLTGLLPTAVDLAAFEQDESPDAYEKVVDRLLQSPHFGVRWARHWLDVAGYAETDGVQGKDPSRPHAWRYRDYVVESLNQDKPYDQFVREQLAGDELIQGEPSATSPRDLELLTASGFLRMAPDATSETDTIVDRNQAVAESLKVVGTAVLGLTVGCAQCHDHRYDPISAEDYYRFRAIFDPAFPLQHWKKPADRTVDMTPPDVVAIRNEHEAKAHAMDVEIRNKCLKRGEEIYKDIMGKLSEDVQAALVTALNVPDADKTAEQKKLLETHPTVRKSEVIADMLSVYDAPFHSTMEDERLKVTAFRNTAPPKVVVMVTADAPNVDVPSHVFFRGDPESPKQAVTPGEIFVLARYRPADADPFLPKPTTDSASPASAIPAKRRLAYAQSITDGRHPLVSRVAVNRIWLHLFGQGLVATPGDFGSFGARPSHPELLDWLANEFVGSGWSTKRLVRMVVLSKTYQQRSTKSAKSEEVDPSNHLLSHANLRRMDAEAIRDCILMAAGVLNEQLGGPSVPVAEDEDGKAVIGKLKLRDGLFAGIESVGDQANRRSIFIEVKRSLPLNMLDTFDLPAMVPNCDLRRSSTVAPQSLWFLNDSLVISLADRMADDIIAKPNGGPAECVTGIYRRLFSAEPTDKEVELCSQFLLNQSELFRNDPDPAWQENVQKWPHAPNVRALSSLCQSLLSSNRFLYVD